MYTLIRCMCVLYLEGCGKGSAKDAGINIVFIISHSIYNLFRGGFMCLHCNSTCSLLNERIQCDMWKGTGLVSTVVVLACGVG